MRDRQGRNRKPITIRQILTLIAILAAFGTNIWANIDPPNGLNIGEISQQIFPDVLITPANYAFAIWGLIYLGVISLAVYQILPAQSNNLLLQQIGYKLAIASMAQVVWVFCFLYRQYALSFLAMLGILLPLIAAYWRLPFKRHISRWDRWLIRTPISIYLAWISVATIVNGATVLESWQWNGWGIGAAVWTVIMLLLAGFITHLVTLPRLDFAYAGVFVWASIAIAIKNSDIVLISGTAIGLSIALIVLLISFSFYAPSHRNLEN
ncbi:tryptophan-rich sensory protein [Pleurocapsales cyanobacterium LEGE 10410]|nr:tryptophan-rich sensory protein [Pleurocapsales cyanobacterium LEGE 10410]